MFSQKLAVLNMAMQNISLNAIFAPEKHREVAVYARGTSTAANRARTSAPEGISSPVRNAP